MSLLKIFTSNLKWLFTIKKGTHSNRAGLSFCHPRPSLGVIRSQSGKIAVFIIKLKVLKGSGTLYDLITSNLIHPSHHPTLKWVRSVQPENIAIFRINGHDKTLRKNDFIVVGMGPYSDHKIGSLGVNLER